MFNFPGNLQYKTNSYAKAPFGNTETSSSGSSVEKHCSFKAVIVECLFTATCRHANECFSVLFFIVTVVHIRTRLVLLIYARWCFQEPHRRDMIPTLPSAPSVKVMKPVAASAPFLDVKMSWKKWESVGNTIGSSGGVISSRKCDIQLVVPPDAVSKPERFTVTVHAVSGESPLQGATTADVIKLKPHNTQFSKPVQLKAGHARVFTANSQYSVALFYSADGSEWQEAAVLTHVDQMVKFEDNVITVDKSHVCIETRHFCCWLCYIFHSFVNIDMNMFVPRIESGKGWKLKVYLMNSKHTSRELGPIKEKEEGWNYVWKDDLTLCCLRRQQVKITVVNNKIPHGWQLLEQHGEIGPISYDELVAGVCKDRYYMKRTIVLFRKEGNDTIPITHLELSVRIAEGAHDVNAVIIPVFLEECRREATASWHMPQVSGNF